MALNPLLYLVGTRKKIKVDTKEHEFVLGIALSLDWMSYMYLRVGI